MLSRSQLLGLSTEAQDCFAVVESLQKFISVALDLVDLTNPLSSLNKVAIVLQVYSGSMDTQLKELKYILEQIHTYALAAMREQHE
jgi:hypothetical protein